MRRHRRSPLCRVIGHELILISSRRLTHSRRIRTKRTKHWHELNSNVSPPQVREISNFEKFMSSYDILGVDYAMEEDTRFPYTLLLIQRFIYSHSKCHSKPFFFFALEKYCPITNHTNENELNKAESDSRTLKSKNLLRIRLNVSHSRTVSHIVPNTRIETLNVFIYCGPSSFISWPNSWNFIWINKSPFQKCIYSFATRSWRNLGARNNIFWHIVNIVRALSAGSRANFINSHLFNEPITPQSSRWP